MSAPENTVGAAASGGNYVNTKLRSRKRSTTASLTALSGQVPKKPVFVPADQIPPPQLRRAKSPWTADSLRDPKEKLFKQERFGAF